MMKYNVKDWNNDLCTYDVILTTMGMKCYTAADYVIIK